MSPRHGPMRGFSLIEVMVSMVIALLTFLVMLQMFQSWDRSKRTTASGSGSQVSGAVGMYRMERDLRLAGFGMFGSPDFGCTVSAFHKDRPVTQFSFPLRAVRIVDGAGGSPDRIEVFYGSSEDVGNQGFATVSAGGQPYTNRNLTDHRVEMDIGALGGFRLGDLVLLASDPDGDASTMNSECRLVQINQLVDRRQFEHKDAAFINPYVGGPASVAPFNRNGGPENDAALGTTGRAYGLGPSPQRRVWQIRDPATMRPTLAFVNDLDREGDSDDFTDIADNVVNLQAQYGVAATPGSAPENQCVRVAGNPTNQNPWWTVTDPGAANGNNINCLNFIWALRVALLVRSDEFDKLEVTPRGTPPSWSGGNFTMTHLDGSDGTAAHADPRQDWTHYRYKVFESVIPQKNIFWGARN